MKDKLGIILFYVFLIIIAIGSIFGLIFFGINVFDFLGNAVNSLGGGFAGVFLFISIAIGIAFAIYGIVHPPQFLDDAFANAPKWVQSIAGTLLLLVIGGLIIAFISLGQ